METTIFIVIIIAMVVCAIIRPVDLIDKKKTREREEILDTNISRLHNNESFIKIVGQKSRYAFLLDKVGRKVYYVTTQKNIDVPFDKIISVEIIEDNSVLFSKSASVGGAILGGVLAGEAGMIVGGLSGETKKEKNVSKVNVKIKIRDYSTPSLLIECFNSPELLGNKEIWSTHKVYLEELHNAQKIADYVSVIIDEVGGKGRDASQTAAKRFSSERSSAADELAKLASLKEQGILTDEEFRIQKEKILNQ